MKRVFSIVLVIGMLTMIGCQSTNPPAPAPATTAASVTTDMSDADATEMTEPGETSQEPDESTDETDETDEAPDTDPTSGKPAASDTEPITTTTAKTPAPAVDLTLRRGLNFAGDISADVLDPDSWILSKEYYVLVKQKGFDHIRLPVNFGLHSGAGPDYTIDKDFLRRVDQAVNAALDSGLILILDFHGFREINTEADGYKQQYYKMWEQIANRYRNYPPQLFFELINEPNSKAGGVSPLNNAKLNEIQMELFQIIRKTNPTRMICAAIAEFNAVGKIWNTELPLDDPNIIMSVHNYDKMEFTHQGATWGGRPTDRVLFTDDIKETITKNLERAADYQERTGRKVWLSEWGTYLGTAVPGDVAEYAAYFTAECERLKMGWAYWEFCSGFGAYDMKTGQWKDFIINHLID